MRAWSESGTAPARSSATSFPVPCCGHTEGDTMTMAEPVRVFEEDQVLVVTLDRPKANAVDVATSRALYEAFDRLRRDPRLRAGILTGAGDRFFCAGWDLKAAAAGEAIEADHGPGGFAGITEFFDIGKPVIAAVNGLAFGGGFELGLVADAGGLLRLPARLPRAIAVECLLTGRGLTAAEAARWGLVNRVVPAVELMPAARELAGAISASAPLAVAAVLEILRETEATSMRTGYSVLRSGVLPAYRAMLESQDA